MSHILLNPGPVSISSGVRRAIGETDLCHREPEYFLLQREVIDGLAAVYGCDLDTWATVTLGGSGTTALEAMLSSIPGPGERVLVTENGVYGERLSKIASIHDIPSEAIHQEWGAEPDLEQLDRFLAGGRFKWLAMVHHETTTGRLNPLEEMLDLCARHGVGLLADTVSSFAAENIPFDHPALAACAGTANKCLHGIPGLAFVMLRPELLNTGHPPRSLYLHLPGWFEAQSNDSTPFTPPVNSVQGLHWALKELEQQGGWRARRARYRMLAEAVRASLENCGVRPLLPPAHSSCVLRSYHIPENLNYNSIHDEFKRRGFVIYAGQGGLSNDIFRISTMGEITDQDLQRLQQAITEIFEA